MTWSDWSGDWSGDWSDWSDWATDWASDWGSDWQGDWSDLWLPFGLDAIWFRLPSAPGLGGSLATPPAAHPENVQTKSFGFDSFAVAAFSALDAIGSSLLGLVSNRQAKPSPPTHQQIESGSENELVKRTKEEGYVTAPIFEAAANFNRWWQKEVVDKHFYTGTPKTPLEHFAAFGTGAVRSVGSTVEFFGMVPSAIEYHVCRRNGRINASHVGSCEGHQTRCARGDGRGQSCNLSDQREVPGGGGESWTGRRENVRNYLKSRSEETRSRQGCKD